MEDFLEWNIDFDLEVLALESEAEGNLRSFNGVSVWFVLTLK